MPVCKICNREYLAVRNGMCGPCADAKADMAIQGHAAQVIRQFETGATRSPLGNKLQYEGYLNPLVIKRFAQYMEKHQTDSAGNQREADNWQAGIPLDSLMDSGQRHFMDWWLHHRDYPGEASEPVDEALCALLFNAMAYLKQILEARQ